MKIMMIVRIMMTTMISMITLMIRMMTLKIMTMTKMAMVPVVLLVAITLDLVQVRQFIKEFFMVLNTYT